MRTLYAACATGPPPKTLPSEVFHRALLHLDAWEDRGIPFATWLYRIAHNAIVDRAAEQARAPVPLSIEPLTDAGIEEAEHRASLFRRMRELPSDQRRVLELRFGEDRSLREIAGILGRSEGAVKQLQLRALENLRQLVGGRHA